MSAHLRLVTDDDAPIREPLAETSMVDGAGLLRRVFQVMNPMTARVFWCRCNAWTGGADRCPECGLEVRR